MIHMIQVCGNFHRARAFITNTPPDEAGARTRAAKENLLPQRWSPATYLPSS